MEKGLGLVWDQELETGSGCTKVAAEINNPQSMYKAGKDEKAGKA